MAIPQSHTKQIAVASDGFRRTWLPGGGLPASASQRVITGTGFGAGPNVVLFDSMSAGVHGQPVDMANGPEIGSWAGDSTITGVAGAVPGVKYYEYGGRVWMAGRDTSNLEATSSNIQGLTYVHPTAFREFRLSFRTLIPTGFLMPGTSEPNTNDNIGSNWKLTWGGKPETGYGPDPQGPDVCIPTLNGPQSVIVSGNTITPTRNSSGSQFYTALSGVDENFFSWYQKPGTGRDTSDGIAELIAGKSSGVSITKSLTANPFAQGPGNVPSVLEYRNWTFNSYTGNVPTYVNVLSVWADMYLAVGDNSYAHIITGDAPTLAACTKQHEVPPDSWSDTQIAFTPPSWAGDYTHIYLADGTLIENAGGV